MYETSPVIVSIVTLPLNGPATITIDAVSILLLISVSFCKILITSKESSTIVIVSSTATGGSLIYITIVSVPEQPRLSVTESAKEIVVKVVAVGFGNKESFNTKPGFQT